MALKNFFNTDRDQYYVLHFPGSGLDRYKNLLEENIARVIQISDKLSIISTMNKECFDESYLARQLEANNIKLHNNCMNEIHWSNTIKIKAILDLLTTEITTEYVLILDGRDVIIVNDLDESFIEKYKTFGKPIVYNATTWAHPNTPIEPLQEILATKGKSKFLNAGVCVGTREALIEFYGKAQVINEKHQVNNSEQLIIRLCRQQNKDLIAVDTENRMFRALHHNDTVFEENANGDYVLI